MKEVQIVCSGCGHKKIYLMDDHDAASLQAMHVDDYPVLTFQAEDELNMKATISRSADTIAQINLFPITDTQAAKLKGLSRPQQTVKQIGTGAKPGALAPMQRTAKK